MEKLNDNLVLKSDEDHIPFYIRFALLFTKTQFSVEYGQTIFYKKFGKIIFHLKTEKYFGAKIENKENKISDLIYKKFHSKSSGVIRELPKKM